MSSIELINEFFSHKSIAVVGVSKSGKGFGYIVYNKLRDSGHNVFPINNKAENIDGNTCYHSLKELQGQTESAVLVIPPDKTKEVIRDASEAGVKNIWFQPGSESKEAVQYAKELNFNVIEKECVIMFMEPVKGFHKFHRTITKLTGKYPKN